MKSFLISRKAAPILISAGLSVLIFITGMLSKGVFDFQHVASADIALLLEVAGLVFSTLYLSYRFIFEATFFKNWAKYRNLIFLLICLVVLVIVSFLSFIPTFKPDYTQFVFAVAMALLPMIFGWSVLLLSVEERLTKKIDELVIKLPGYLEAVNDASVFQFEGTIFGWNPNWALELNSAKENPIYRSIAKVHVSRLTGSDVTQIQYVFLENYKPPSGEDLYFGVENFKVFLKRLIEDYGTLNLEKYKIWVIPESNWSTECELSKLIKQHLHVVVIAGFKGDIAHSLMFFNMSPFISNVSHTHCLKIKEVLGDFYPTQSRILASLNKCGINPKKIVVNSANTVELQECTA